MFQDAETSDYTGDQNRKGDVVWDISPHSTLLGITDVSMKSILGGI